MKNREDLIEKQKILIKKNNIISRITYSQLEFNQEDERYSIKSEGKNKDKSKEKRNIISYKKLKNAPSKRTVNDNSFTLSIDTKDKRTLDPNPSIKDRK